MIAVAGLVGYLLGTFPSADIAARLATRGRTSIRNKGSGNPGSLNTLRVLGVRWGAFVLVLDVGKGLAAGFAGMVIAGDAGAYVGATAAIAGHVFPVWTRFRGGKGVATSVGACLATFPAFFPVDFVVVLLGALRSRQAEHSSRIACAIWVTSAALWWRMDWPNLWGPAPGPGMLASAVVGSALILVAFSNSRRQAAQNN